MKELGWMPGWHIEIYELDQQNRNVLNLINRLISISSHEDEMIDSSALNQIIDNELIPYLDDFSSNVIEILAVFESANSRKMGKQYRLYKQDYLAGITDLINYIRGLRINRMLNSICIGEIKHWFILYMMRIKLLMTFWRDLRSAPQDNLYIVSRMNNDFLTV